MPMGMLALADYLDNAGYSVRVIHLDIEEEKQNFSLKAFIKNNDPRLICFSYHWHTQSSVFDERVREVKKDFPHIKIAAGGFSATFFSSQILKYNNCIDFVIKGDAEEPLRMLAEHIKRGAVDFGVIPNLVWRKNGKVRVNSGIYRISQEVLDSLRYSRFDLLESYKDYLKIPWETENSILGALHGRQNIFYYNPGRGCSVNCAFCGGSNESQCIINARKQPLMKSHESVIRDLTMAKAYGVDVVYICFDPFPKSSYYPVLFRKIKDSGLKFRVVFECWSLPTKNFVDTFKNIFLPGSWIVVSPETGSERVRNRVKGFSYSNRALIKSLDYMKNKGVLFELFFASGLPFEKKSDLELTKKFLQVLKKRYQFILQICPIEVEPSSPMSIHPNKFKVRIKRKTYSDYVDAHTYSYSLGYNTFEFSEQEILDNINGLNREFWGGIQQNVR